jgi:hypothetical protein
MPPELRGWQRDPFGVHEFRFFSDDGKPTLLVRDGDTKSYDKPPVSADGAYLWSPEPASGRNGASPGQGHPPWPADLAHQSASHRNGTVRDTFEGPLAEGNALSPVDNHVVFEPPPGATLCHNGAAVRDTKALSRPAKFAYAGILTAMAVSAVALAILHLDKGPTQSRGSSTTSERSTSTSSSDSTSSTDLPTTTLTPPSSPQPTAAVAAADLISSWASDNRAEALTVATTSAVADLFAAHYSAGLVIDRGCSDAFQPIVCTYGPPGGSAPTDQIYEIYVTQSARGWYVSSVAVDN